jgi:hypothetical protein
VKVKLRPGTHFAPVPQGIHWSHRGRSFVLTAPVGLYRVLDGQLGLLTTGTDVDELVSAVGDEAARPVFDRLVQTLLRQDVLLNLDAVTVPAPDARTAARYAEVLSFLEARCADPYRVFADLRTSRVAVVGGGPAVPVVVRALSAHGTGAAYRADARSAGDAAAVVLVDDLDQPLDLVDAAAQVPPGTPVVPVFAGAEVALVGEARSGADLSAFVEICRRADMWPSVDPDSAAPRPVSAVLAGSLAARAVLDALTGAGDEPPGPILVYGRDVATRRLPVSAATDRRPARCWLPVHDFPEPGPAAPGGGRVPGPAAPADLLAAWAPVTARWTGLVHPGRDLDLVQLPMALATADLVTGGAPARVAGWGADRAQAGAHAVLAAARRLVARFSRPGLVAAAGATTDRWLLDGVLRVLAADLLGRPPGRDLGWADLTTAAQRTRWSLLEDYFERPVRLRVSALPGLDWSLATVTDGSGEIRVGEWGYSPDSAVPAALAAALACAQAEPPVRELLAGWPAGTQILQWLPEARLREGIRQVRALLAARGQRAAGERLVHDPVLGEPPLVCGPVWLS